METRSMGYVIQWARGDGGMGAAVYLERFIIGRWVRGVIVAVVWAGWVAEPR